MWKYWSYISKRHPLRKSLGAKGFSKWTVMQNRRPAWLQSSFRTTKSVFWSDHHKDLVSIQWAELKSQVWTRGLTNLAQLHQICQEERAQVPANYCEKLAEAHSKCLTQVIQFKGKGTKYDWNVCNLQTLRKVKRNCLKKTSPFISHYSGV